MKEISRIPKPNKKKVPMEGLTTNELKNETVEPLRSSLKQLPRNIEHPKESVDQSSQPFSSSLCMSRKSLNDKQMFSQSSAN